MVGQSLGNEPGQMRRACAVHLLLMMAQTPAPASGPTLSFTATTDNVAGAPDTIRIDLLRWSTDAERDQLVSAWSMTRAAGRGGSAGVGSGAVGRGAAGRGGRGGRGGA